MCLKAETFDEDPVSMHLQFPVNPRENMEDSIFSSYLGHSVAYVCACVCGRVYFISVKIKKKQFHMQEHIIQKHLYNKLGFVSVSKRNDANPTAQVRYGIRIPHR